MSLARKEIFDILEQNREQIRSFGVRQLGLFGSFARGENTESSDLDFLVEFETKSFDAYIGLKQFLEELFGRRVDLVLPNTIKPRLRNRILTETVYAQGL
ncbi:MAG: nucleotidyltransferase family protein [Acidobacteria bacterium]|jgi:predicted nucleotidyltransferase|nr:nucleotidyltransferase family protein [Acidobacteriota bacterium]